MKETTVEQLAAVVDGVVEGDGNVLIRGIANIEDAQDGDVTFAENPKLLTNAARSEASAVIAPRSNAQTEDSIHKPLIRVANPRFAFAQVLRIFAPQPKIFKGIHPSAHVGLDPVIGENVSIHASAVVGDNVQLGANTVIYPFSYIGDNVVLGENCVIYPHVVLHENTIIGNNVVIHSGSVLGTDGFGYMFIDDRHYKIPQIGRVIIQDDVEIGANVTIDKARTGSTTIGRGTKIDNLVHIGHNCTVGENCVIVAQVGVSGSVNIGRGVILAGQVGIKDHVTIGDGVIVGAKSGVISDLPNGVFVSGRYARSHQSEMRKNVEIERLPESRKRIKSLEKRIAILEKALGAVEETD
ncbi:MAG: UDP-3-O-(3-hydroxymyristoyl)glucosamine N-acyltransferase [Capsulimonadaceae bacterium]|nr:UDP-3-O-(3-hydroxymyristoyl)glucosamine N-acyltransferase [Capsulimonadaceae bacterium]